MAKVFTKIMTRAVMTLLLMASTATMVWAQSSLDEDVVVFDATSEDNLELIAAFNEQTKTVVIKGLTLKAVGTQSAYHSW